ncbi:membrane protein [Bathymodiolus azoricus thioautotrophic gill symbiont]|uniref:Membrane protein n=1 Tax=Bathymodiolus azoricus thioautotrophic gill symbiont TaxID=235205 RepID=A0A1H6M8H0_9GAMM|nr:membrane protein [Bathymodiolus azoricus thioautotrophic gill symbiont]
MQDTVDPFRECRYFQLFFIDFQLFNFLLRIIPVKIIQLSSLQKLILLTVIHIMFNMIIYICY